MRKSVIIFICLVVAAVAEPPVENETFDGLSSQYGPPSGGLSSQYGPPSGGPSSQYGPPSQNGRQNGNGYRHGNGNGNGNGNGHGHGHGAPSSQYGVSFGGNGSGHEVDEPANYEFQYDVDAPEFGVKFGHQESRQGDVAVGSYNVLLPDGRVQRVEYEADVNGYKPKISYEDTGSNGNGYPRGGPVRNGAGANESNGGYHLRK